MFLIIYKRNLLNVSFISVVMSHKLAKQTKIMSLSGCDNVTVLKTLLMELLFKTFKTV